MESRKQRSRMKRQKFTVERRKYSRLSRLNWFLWVLLLLCVATTCFFVAYFQALQFAWLNYIIYTVSALLSVIILVLMVTKRFKWGAFILNITGLLIFGVLLYRGYHVVTVYDKMQHNQTPLVTTMSVLVPKNSSIVTIQQVGNENIAAPTQQDNEKVKTLADDIQTNMHLKVGLFQTDSYLSAYKMLESESIRGIAMNSAYASVLEKVVPTYSATVKSVYDLNVPSPTQVKPNHEAPSFNVLVSAVDSNLPITSLGRSDVSLVVSANTQKNRALVTQTPSSAFVQIYGTPNLNMDKIANDFIFGVDNALKTSETLYDTSIQYYVRIHLEKLAQIIERLGAISVHNDTEFSTSYGGYTFQVGQLTLNAKQALGYMREEVVVDGVSKREQHQLAILSEVLKKLASFDVLMHADSYIEQLQSAVQTNLPFKRLMALMNVLFDQQVNVQTLQVKMHPDVQSAVLPGVSLPMGEVDQNSLNTLRENIKNVLQP
ncbi:LCP family protein [Carnobacteriaceae bacterium zg-ZUI252]|nr:LCP family protein [Carnobacteriaceae bacterium zg-ZUI252]